LPWIWNEAKNRANQAKHKLSFELAQRVFDDPFAASRPDPCPDEERWQTIGLIGTVAVFVVHTAFEADPASGEEFGRIISARKATTHERKAYEEGTF
jgi:uncharacterized DUF497 family protein